MTSNRILLTIFGIASAIIFISSCSSDERSPGIEFMAEMYRSPSYETYSSNPNYTDSMSARQPVAGTVPREYSFFNYPSTNEGYAAAGKDIATIPASLTDADKEEGKRLYGIYCGHCHGEQGQGDGILVQNGKFPPPPSYSAGKSSRGGDLKDLSAGKIYHTITYGLNLMGPHAALLDPVQRWQIVSYVQKLQTASAGAADTTASADTSNAQ